MPLRLLLTTLRTHLRLKADGPPSLQRDTARGLIFPLRADVPRGAPATTVLTHSQETTTEDPEACSQELKEQVDTSARAERLFLR